MLIAVIIGVLLGAILDTAVLHDAQVTIGGDAILAGGTFVMAGFDAHLPVGAESRDSCTTRASRQTGREAIMTTQSERAHTPICESVELAMPPRDYQPSKAEQKEEIRHVGHVRQAAVRDVFPAVPLRQAAQVAGQDGVVAQPLL